MNTSSFFTFAYFTRALAARSWRYDRDAEQFMDGDRVQDVAEVLALVPGKNLEWLLSWCDDQHDRMRVAANRK